MTTPDAPPQTAPPFLDWRAVPVPAALADAPRDHRGFIIPFTVRDGTDHPDFRRTQPTQMAMAVRRHLCGVCGNGLGYWVAFIGGPLSMANRAFTDAGMHEDCAEYALRVCPFLSRPTGRYTTEDGAPGINPLVSTERPERFGLGLTRGYELRRDRQGQAFIQAAPFKRIRWFSAYGQELPADAV